MSKAEDEDDVVAAKAARAEQVAERAEFDECFVPRVSTSEQVCNTVCFNISEFVLVQLEWELAKVSALHAGGTGIRIGTQIPRFFKWFLNFALYTLFIICQLVFGN